MPSAPTLGTRSPPKPLSATSSRDSSNKSEHPSHHPARPTDNSQEDDSALARFARIKQREQANTTTTTNLATNIRSRTRTTTTSDNPDPTKWALKGTSVQAANAIHQAAMALNPKDSWASNTPRTAVPRSTSVEYEKETLSTSTRRLNPPPSRNGPPPQSRSAASAAKLAKQASVKFVPDSEAEGEVEATTPRGGQQQERAKTPLESVIDIAKRTAFYLRPRSTEPEQQSQNLNGIIVTTTSQRDFQTQASPAAGVKTRNKPSPSNPAAAYRPTESDLERSDEDDVSHDGKRRKRKGRKNMIGPLTTLPVVGKDKKRRKRRSEDEEEEDDSASDGRVSPQRSIHSSQRHSQSRELQRPPSRAPSLPRHPSIPPPTSPETWPTLLMQPEHEEVDKSQHSRRAFSVGGFLGRIVNLVLRLFINLFIYVLSALSAITNIVGQGLGGAFDALFTKPARWIRRSNPAFVLKWLIIAAVLYYAWSSLESFDLLSYIPSLPSQTTRYRAPEAPADNIAEISARLQSLENAFAGLSLDTEQSRARIDNQLRGHSDVSGRLGALESRLQKEGTRAAEDRNVDRITASQGLQTVRHEIDALRSIVASAQQSEREARAGPASDEEARRKLSALEERIGNVEGGVREALELGKHPITSSGKKALTIKASDGQDVTELIGHLVDTAISRHSKDTLAKADFALVSGGAIVPQGFRQQVIGYLTGNGFAIGRPPITALHHETHNGYCWPFKGDQGQLGVTLAHPVFIDEITIDHVASEIAWDLRSAPRKMEVWGLVEGAKNHAKVASWEDSRNEAGLEVPTQPRSLPHSAKYVRVAQFEYDIHKLDSAVQSFPADEDVRALELDFGIVALRVLSNWGKEFTCLYRFRVHGRKFEEPPLDDMPTPGADAETA
ncbi:hypothetical protein BGW80DRAFT_1312790 [Lactifluus volemus]|nr:hypothetical protein BGW80DRAFT_1312790 [Lactifluus volemus]